jgi:hypothetical protein
MKKLCLLFLFLASNVGAQDYTGSRFNDVWSQVKSDPYNKLPQKQVTFRSLLGGAVRKSANRTVSNRADILPHFNKLAHPNGVCLKGLWEISQENPYGGLFKQGSQGLIIARASVAMTATKAGHHRAFGLAGKIFPTLNGEEIVETANFFTVDDLGGTKAKHFTDVTLSNAPAVTPNLSLLGSLFYIMKLTRAFKSADQNPNERQVYEISELGEADTKNVKTPRWMGLRAQEGQSVDEADFRDELNLANREHNLIFDIMVADSEDENGQRNWTAIGTIEFDESVASDSGDHRLHFHHPKWKALNH